jgi:hypothetical protein
LELLLNDLSLHGQFQDVVSFRTAIDCLLTMRRTARRFNRTIHCHRNILHGQVTPAMKMSQAIQELTVEQRRSLLQWITREGPFWEEFRKHCSNDWLEWNSKVVTDTAAGEAGWCCLNGIEQALVSLTPSDLNFSPVPIVWVIGDGVSKNISVKNYWQAAPLESDLRAAPMPLETWKQVGEIAVLRFKNLTFLPEAFRPLIGHPFVPGAAQRILVLLDILNQFKACFDVSGKRTLQGHKIYEEFFTGKKGEGGRGALFSDSSDKEKSAFSGEMTFNHPDNARQKLFCHMHGKIQTPQFRIHFSWPIRADEPLYIAYVGPKITKS